MSKSYHTTRKDLKGKTKKEIDEMLNDPDSILHKLAEKSSVKKIVRKQRQIKKEKNNLDKTILLNQTKTNRNGEISKNNESGSH